jgi:hypothetical protein
MIKKFRKVRKTKKGTPLKYLSGAKNRSAVEKEIKKTARLYKSGKLTKAMMDKISKKRVASAKKKTKKKR